MLRAATVTTDQAAVSLSLKLLAVWPVDVDTTGVGLALARFRHAEMAAVRNAVIQTHPKNPANLVEGIAAGIDH